MPTKRRLKLGSDLNSGSVRDIRITPSGAAFNLDIKVGLTVDTHPSPTPGPTNPQYHTHRDFDDSTQISASVDFIKISAISQTESTLLISATLASKIPGTGALTEVNS
jgi:hypothetical protein